VNDHIRFTAGIDNLLNKDPPVVGGTLGNTNLGEYDLVGRTYWAGVRIQF
jgi:iron complex outermembrane recepter protein